MKKHIILSLSALFTSQLLAVCPDGKTYQVTLTFDDGPNNILTPKVLNVLNEEKVRGTFFVLGEHFSGGKSNPDNKNAYAILDRAKREGHYIGSHTYKHLVHSKLSSEGMSTNINKSTALLKEYLSPILRLPYGDGSFRSSNPDRQRKNDMVMATVRNAGFKHVGWDIDTNDWDPKKRSLLLPRMLKDICSERGGIILFHDVQKNTVDHLQEWIKAIKAEGHSFVGLEKFVPEVRQELITDSCDQNKETGPLKGLRKSVNDVMKKFKDEDYE